MECNSANLIVNHGWRALLVDGDPANIRRADEFYATSLQTWFDAPVTTSAWVTAEIVDDLLSGAGFTGEIDLLSLDLDGMDFWVWRAMTVVDPRVVVAEFTPIFGPDEARVLAYDPAFVRPADIPFAGASLGAMEALARSRGYRLVGVERRGFNAFFVKAGLAAELPAPTVAECLDLPSVRRTAERMRSDLSPYAARLNWVAVSAD